MGDEKGSSKVDWKKEVYGLLDEKGLELSKNQVRELLAKKLGETNVKESKKIINDLIEKYIEEKNKDEDEEEPKEQEKSPEKPKKKKEEPKKVPKKRKKKEGSEEENEVVAKKKAPKATVKTRTGKEPPKGCKKMQESLMTAAEFQKLAKTMECEIFGNTISGPPRSFTSGNRGWWAGGKIEVPIGKKNVWEIGRAVQQECRDRSRMPSSA
eukprot:TRINITY_DN25750_c0_g1_i2.p1 TRINITY_DN25750_c0_g1~~TRINITY_DN25750_c0_g1_i2.p1  ORF type:complete len:211 (-),score=48.58 TRINITY_DN25750_c0_g1_i2:16-648(-)